MRVQYLETLLAVHEEGSVAAAARRVNLSESAVSVQIRKLEQEIGKDLTQKGKRPLALTAFGTRFCEMSTGLIDRHDALLRFARGDSVEGEVQIGFVSTTLQTLLPTILRTLNATFPLLEIRIVSGLSQELSDNVRAGRLDFAFVSAAPRQSVGVVVTDIAKEPLRLIAARESTGGGNANDVLASRPFISFGRDTWLGMQIQEVLAARFPSVHQAVELDSIDAIENLVSKDQGVSIVPERILARPLADRFRVVRLPGPTVRRSLQLISSHDSTRKSVRDEMIATCDRYRTGVALD